MRLEFDGNRLKMRVNAARDIGMAALGEQALKDANYFCKEDSGVLIDSSYIGTGISPPSHSENRTEKESKILSDAEGSRLKPDENGTIELVWDTPYAKRQYYTGQPSPDKNPNASKMWAHKGEAAHKADHLAILQKAAREG